VKQALNAWFDTLPVTRVGKHGREQPTFLACGVTGFYLALIALFGAGLLTGKSMLVLAAVAMVAALSFFVYTYVRRWIVGRESLVLLEHVWFALACEALLLYWTHQPVLAYLDLVAVALCPFLAAGRLGCTLVGCCHGHPSSLGIRYTEECAADGFSSHLVGVRLLPVPLIEGVGLLLIGGVGLAAIPHAGPGKVFTWYLIAYSVIRFGLEGLRGDERPHLIGLSQARWMSIVEAGFAISMDGQHHATPAVVVTLLILAISLLGFWWWRHPHRRLLDSSHVTEVHRFIRDAASRIPMPLPLLRTTSGNVGIAVSTGADDGTEWVHVSIALAGERSDLPLLCELAARALPGLSPNRTGFADNRVLHIVAPLPMADGVPTDDNELHRRACVTYGAAVRHLQQLHESPASQPAPPSVQSIDGFAAGLPTPVNVGHAVGRPWYFTSD
jgi:prolipoprotein diacylglyceryltransferase